MIQFDFAVRLHHPCAVMCREDEKHDMERLGQTAPWYTVVLLVLLSTTIRCSARPWHKS